jgi:hypothetical protein
LMRYRTNRVWKDNGMPDGSLGSISNTDVKDRLFGGDYRIVHGRAV